MNFTKNLILAICFSINPEGPGFSFYIKPSVNFIPKEVFTNQTNWELVKSNKGINVYSQWITLHDGFKTRRLKGELNVRMAMPDLVAFLLDGGRVKNWMVGVSESYNLKIQDESSYSYARFSIPWPFNDQDLIVENRLDYPNGKDTAYIYLTSYPEMLPRMKGLKRMENFYGYWKVFRVSPTSSSVEYAVFSRSEPIAPRWIQDPIIMKTFWSSLDNLAACCLENR